MIPDYILPGWKTEGTIPSGWKDDLYRQDSLPGTLVLDSK